MPLPSPVSGNMPGPVWVVNPLECKGNVEYCLGLRQNVTYARPFAHQSPGIGLECEEWKVVCVGSNRM